MALAIFDLDNTLLAGDSDRAWGDFLADRGVVDRDYYKQRNQDFYQDYLAGRLNIEEYLEFSACLFTGRPLEQLELLHGEFMDAVIAPMFQERARQLLAWHRQRGDVLLVVTSTPDFITWPIVRALGVEHLLATELEREGARFTGRIVGVPCFGGGKAVRLRAWLRQQGMSLAGSYAYSDSHNDLPLLHLVDHPVAVDADEILRSQARQRGWPVLSLRGAPQHPVASGAEDELPAAKPGEAPPPPG